MLTQKSPSQVLYSGNRTSLEIDFSRNQILKFVHVFTSLHLFAQKGNYSFRVRVTYLSFQMSDRQDFSFIEELYCFLLTKSAVLSMLSDRHMEMFIALVLVFGLAIKYLVVSVL